MPVLQPRRRAGLLERLARTVGEACEVLLGLDTSCLTDAVVVQGTDTTPLHAALHVVEHFAWHTGQAVWIAKARAGPRHGLAFYDDRVVNRLRNT